MQPALSLPLFLLLFELGLLLLIALPVLISARLHGIALRMGVAMLALGAGVGLLVTVDAPGSLVTIGSRALVLVGAGLAYRAISALYDIPLSRAWEIGVPALGFAIYAGLWVLDSSPDHTGFSRSRAFALAIPMATNAGLWLHRLRLHHTGTPSIGTRYLQAGAVIAILGNLGRSVAFSMVPTAPDPIHSTLGLPAVLGGMLTSLLFVVGVMLEGHSRSQQELLLSNARLDRDANTDSLTGVGNRRQMEVAGPAALARARAAGVPVALLMLDIDHFKRVNDTFGHHAGDVVLREVAQLCGRGLRRHDVLVRWGGEEFALLLSHADHAIATRVSERIVSAVRSAVIPELQGAALTISVGFAVLDVDEDLPAGQRRADAALYEAKQAGRDRHVAARAETQPGGCSQEVPGPPRG